MKTLFGEITLTTVTNDIRAMVYDPGVST